MQYARQHIVAQDRMGNALSGAQVLVRNESNGATSSIYSNDAGTSALSNPFTCDTDGQGYFHARDGVYRVTVTSGSIVRDYRYVRVGPSFGVSHTDPTNGYTLAFDSGSGLWVPSPLRESLTANRTYYVRTDGSDSNTGLANTSGGAFLTVTKVLNVAAALDLSIYDITAQLGTGTWTENITVNGPWVGKGTVLLRGDTTTPSNVNINSTSGAFNTIRVQNGGRLTVSGLNLGGAGDYSLFADTGATITFGSAMRFTSGSTGHMQATNNATITCRQAYAIAGGATFAHMVADNGGVLDFFAQTCTLSNTPAFTYFVYASANAIAKGQLMTYAGTGATGQRYQALAGGGVVTFGGGANHFPGSIAGVATAPGWYN